ncbi:hypothetical protein [Anaerospora sp.]|uniref:hypothetical protein n=1 Tax=Anaerospora sp. TaxID=1960278 RepID=UPI002898ADBA|nr:hypothetical protein [Anaerospora sp.]
METIKINNETLSFNKIWYVDNVSGNDTTGNGTVNNPYATFAKAYGILTAGDAIKLAAGTYTSSKILARKDVTVIGETYLTTLKVELYLAGKVTLTCYRLIYSANIDHDFDTNRNYWFTINLNNCVVLNDASVTSGSYHSYFNLKLTNCFAVENLSWMGNSNITPSVVVNNSATSFKYFVFYTVKPTPPYSLISAAYNTADYNITSGTWNNAGDPTILNPDGNRSSIGVYGGPYAWDNTGNRPVNKLLFLTSDGIKKYTTSWQSVEGDWPTLTDAHKKALFLSDGMDAALLPTAETLAQLGKYKILRYTDESVSNALSQKITAVPLERLFIPKSLISIANLTHFKKAELIGTLSGRGAMHLLLTTDLLTYKTWDGTTFQNCIKISPDGAIKQKWVSGVWTDTDYAGIAAHVKVIGITADALSSIPMAAWDSMIIGQAGYGFAYLPTIEASTDVCTNDKMTITTIKGGKYRKAVHSAEYDVEYETQDHVILKQSGDWEILYIN